MRSIHLVGPATAAGMLPLCGNWGTMDTDWTAVSAEVTCAACAARIRVLASEAVNASRVALPSPLA